MLVVEYIDSCIICDEVEYYLGGYCLWVCVYVGMGDVVVGGKYYYCGVCELWCIGVLN